MRAIWLLMMAIWYQISSHRGLPISLYFATDKPGARAYHS